MADPRDTALLVLIRNGDTSAIKTLFEKYHSSLCLLAYRFTKDRDTAKDVVQDVFIKFWKNRDVLQINVSLSAYLKKSVINTCLNHLQKEQRHTAVELEKLSSYADTTLSDEHYSYQELSKQLDKAIERLPVRTRAVFLLIRKEEMSYKEVAESLNISLKAVEKEMMKALRLLREMLKDFLAVILLTSTFL